MLVLKRKPGERVFICDDIIVEVMGVQGSRVKLGFQCPQNIPVHREEVHRRICAEQNEEIVRQGNSESRFLPEFA